MMEVVMVVTPFTAGYLRLARQIGVSGIVLRYPGPGLAALRDRVEQVEQEDMRAAVVEGYLPIDRIQLGQEGRQAQLDLLLQLVADMGACRIPVLCYNWMALTDWVRTSLAVPGRGGALCTAFDRAQMDRLPPLVTHAPEPERLWDSLAWFLERILPAAEASGVALAMHPDDPPLPRVRGLTRILHDVEGFERLAGLSPRPANGVCFCQGTFAEMGVDIQATIRRLGPRLRLVHLRDIRGTRERFVETFHDDGQTDMFEAIRTYDEIGFTGPMRPDHVPTLAGEQGEGGYTMQGRLFAVGYLRGLMEAAARTRSPVTG